mmetsp:Transcript_10301/g.24319  ORF Transcript_10301/g.24319 Transcript_10301/m.24319 type:complete len:362 (+) Transcript_10301:640-1725(+)
MVHRRHRLVRALLVLVRLRLRLRKLLLQVLQDALPLVVGALPPPFVLLNLSSRVCNLLLKLLHLIVELVDVVEQREVLVLGLDECRHQLVDVRNARRCLDLCKGLLIRLHLLQRCLLCCFVFGDRSISFDDLLSQLPLVVQLSVRSYSRLLPLSHQLLHFAIAFYQFPQFLPLVLKGCLLPICLNLEHCHLLLRLVPDLVCDVRELNNFLHFTLLLVQIFFELLVDVVEGLSLPSQVVNRFPKLFVECQRFVEFQQALVEAVLQNGDLLLRFHVVLPYSIRTPEFLPLLQNCHIQFLNVRIQLLDPSLLCLNFFGVRFCLIMQLPELGRHGHMLVNGCFASALSKARIQVQILLQLVIVFL